jgi:hypothetical protein
MDLEILGRGVLSSPHTPFFVTLMEARHIGVSKVPNGMIDSSGLIEIDLFPAEVNSLEHPEVCRFRELLEDVALEYHCRLLSFDIECGTVSFSFDSDQLMANILRILQDGSENRF